MDYWYTGTAALGLEEEDSERLLAAMVRSGETCRYGVA